MRDESAALGGLCALLGVVPTKPLSNARRELPSLSRGERLCFTFEFYRHLVPASEVTLEHFVLLATALAQGTEVEMIPCVHCGGIMVVERHPVARRGCDYCSRSRGSYTMEQTPVGERSIGPDARNPQGTLF